MIVVDAAVLNAITGITPRLLPGLAIKSRIDGQFHEISVQIGQKFYTAMANVNNNNYKIVRFNEKPAKFWRNSINGFDQSFSDITSFRNEIQTEIATLPVPDQPQKDLTEVKDFTE